MPTDIQDQIECRRQRALEEITKVANKGNHPLFSLFEVTSVSGRTYHVEVRSLTELHNTCSCPDYKTNLIGTCKHIEGVLLYLKEQHGDRLEALARQRPSGTQIYLHYGVDVTVRVGLPIPKRAFVQELLARTFDPEGILIGARSSFVTPDPVRTRGEASLARRAGDAPGSRPRADRATGRRGNAAASVDRGRRNFAGSRARADRPGPAAHRRGQPVSSLRRHKFVVTTPTNRWGLTRVRSPFRVSRPDQR